jgi:D-alanyl-D-alanine carboxypeptidase
MTAKRRNLLLVFICLNSLHAMAAQKYIFFLHNRFLEMEGINGINPDYGTVEYNDIIKSFMSGGFQVISELRPNNTDMRTYAAKVVRQVDSLIGKGVQPSDITVIGTSKGGYIAQIVSSTMKNPKLNFVFIGSCTEVEAGSGIHFCGNVLSIYESTDKEYGQSCEKIRNSSTLSVPHYREIKLKTGSMHGFLYKALPAWIRPSIQWAKGDYELPPLKKNLGDHIDSLLDVPDKQPFNGIVVVRQEGTTEYLKVMGFSNLENKTPLRLNDQFVIGSISKQITAVIVLRELDKGHIQLHVPIRKYLPWLKQRWADTVTVHHLLTHTHGITSVDEPLLFKPGTSFNYSQIGFHLLGQIVEGSSGKSFALLSSELFTLCRMSNSSHPMLKMHPRLVSAYSGTGDGNLSRDTNAFRNYVAAGSFVSGAYDLVMWNNCLHGGQLLSEKSYTYMTTVYEHAIRQHPIFGLTEYGYGTTISKRDSLLQIGQTGLTPGFVSMNFYFPATKTSVVILENIEYDTNNLKNTFRYHTAILELLRRELLITE